MIAGSDFSFWLGVLALSSVVFLMFLYVVTTFSKLSEQRKALKQFEHLLSLIRFVQQHRGMSLGVISGKSQLRTGVSGIQREINHHIQYLKKDKLAGAERWESFLDHWSRLRTNSISITAEECFQQHNQMVNNLLYLVENVCNNSDLGYGRDHVSVQTYWRQLLVLSESFGQARALGVSALARREANYLEMIRFHLLKDKITDRIHTMEQSLPQDKMNQIIKASVPVMDALESFLHDLSRYPHSSEEYFSIATQSIASVAELLDEEVTLVKAHISRRKDQKHLSLGYGRATA